MDYFKNKDCIVTGAASGIGRALSEDLAHRGSAVILADINASLLEDVVESISNTDYQADAISLDVSNFAEVQNLVEYTFSRYGRLDLIFNNAGVTVGGEVRDCSIDDWRDVIDVNLCGVVNGVTAAYPVMVNQGFGHIVNTTSIEGLVPFPGTVSYVASKYGVVGLSNALRIEGADLGVYVSVVCPGYIKTPIFQTCKMIKIDREKAIASLPDRLGITPEKCASIILRGVQRKQAIIVVTWFAKLLWLLHRISPNFVLWFMRKDLKKSRRQLRIEDC